MPVVRTADAVVHELHGARFTSYASTARGSAELCLWRLDLPAAGPAAVPHVIFREELFAVIEGSLRVSLDGEVHTLGPGEVAIAPAGCALAVENPGPGPAAAWVSTSVGFAAQLADGSRISPPWAN